MEDRESQNPGMVCGGRDLKDHPVHFLCHEQGQVAQSPPAWPQTLPRRENPPWQASFCSWVCLREGRVWFQGPASHTHWRSSTSSPPPAALALRGGFPPPGELCPLLLDGAGAWAGHSLQLALGGQRVPPELCPGSSVSSGECSAHRAPGFVPGGHQSSQSSWQVPSVPSVLVTAFLVSKCFPRAAFVGVGGFGCRSSWSYQGPEVLPVWESPLHTPPEHSAGNSASTRAALLSSSSKKWIEKP